MHQRTPSLPHYRHEQRVPNLKISTISTRVFKQGAEVSSTEGPRVLGFLSRSLQGSPSISIPLGWIVPPWYTGAQHTPSYNQVQTVILLCPRCWSWVGLPLPSRSQVAQSCCLGTWEWGSLQGRTRPHRGGHGSRRRWCPASLRWEHCGASCGSCGRTARPGRRDPGHGCCGTA